jgi:hypothetical protein
MFGWPYTSPSLPSQGICSNVPRTCAPHRRRIREVGSLPLDLAIVSYFIFRLRQNRAPLMETWLLVPRKITSRKHEPQAAALWPVTGEPRLTIELLYFSMSRLVGNYFGRTRTPKKRWESRLPIIFRGACSKAMPSVPAGPRTAGPVQKRDLLRSLCPDPRSLCPVSCQFSAPGV